MGDLRSTAGLADRPVRRAAGHHVDRLPYYNLGLTLRMLGRYNEAFDAFYKAVWSDAWQSAAYFELARIATRRGQNEQAIDLVRRSLVKNAHQHRARHLQIALLRHQLRLDDARRRGRSARARPDGAWSAL